MWSSKQSVRSVTTIVKEHLCVYRIRDSSSCIHTCIASVPVKGTRGRDCLEYLDRRLLELSTSMSTRSTTNLPTFSMVSGIMQHCPSNIVTSTALESVGTSASSVVCLSRRGIEGGGTTSVVGSADASEKPATACSSAIFFPISGIKSCHCRQFPIEETFLCMCMLYASKSPRLNELVRPFHSRQTHAFVSLILSIAAKSRYNCIHGKHA